MATPYPHAIRCECNFALLALVDDIELIARYSVLPRHMTTGERGQVIADALATLRRDADHVLEDDRSDIYLEVEEQLRKLRPFVTPADPTVMRFVKAFAERSAYIQPKL